MKKLIIGLTFLALAGCATNGGPFDWGVKKVDEVIDVVVEPAPAPKPEKPVKKYNWDKLFLICWTRDQLGFKVDCPDGLLD